MKWADYDHTVIDRSTIGALTAAIGAAIGASFLINCAYGLVLHFYFPQQNILYHHCSLIIIFVVFVTFMSSFLYNLYHLRQGGDVIAERLGAVRLIGHGAIPEEKTMYQLAYALSQLFHFPIPKLYILPKELGINSLSIGRSAKDMVIIVTWGALQSLNYSELRSLLTYEFVRIAHGESTRNTNLMLTLSGFLVFGQWGNRIGHVRTERELNPKVINGYVIIGGMIWLMGGIGLVIARIVKYLFLYRRHIDSDRATQTLLESHALLHTFFRINQLNLDTQLHSLHVEEISHCCVFNPLSRQSVLTNYPSLLSRIQHLDGGLLSLADKPKRISFFVKRQWFGSDRAAPVAISHNQGRPLRQKLTNVSFDLPVLSTAERQSHPLPEIIQRALLTSTGCREIIVALFMVRQYKDQNPDDVSASRALIQTLVHMDSRFFYPVFELAMSKVHYMPENMARDFVIRLQNIAQGDGFIGVYDALLIEKVKHHLAILSRSMPVSLSHCKTQLVQLNIAFFHIAPTATSMAVRDAMLQRIFTDYGKICNGLLSKNFDFSALFKSLSGLAKRERLTVFLIVKHAIYLESSIHQDEADGLDLLAWRLGLAQ